MHLVRTQKEAGELERDGTARANRCPVGETGVSIYATHWAVKFPETGDVYPGCDWVEVVGQGVPAHIGTPTPGHGYESGDPYASFLPPAIPMPDDEETPALRAMVIVK